MRNFAKIKKHTIKQDIFPYKRAWRKILEKSQLHNPCKFHVLSANRSLPLGVKES